MYFHPACLYQYVFTGHCYTTHDLDLDMWDYQIA